MSNNHLFVYGTLRRASRHPMARLLRDHAEWVGHAVYRGLLFNLGAYPGAVASDDPAHRVQGEVYRLRYSDILWLLLDRYEQFGGDFPEPNEFVRREQAVWLSGGFITAWVYLYNHSTDGLEILRHGHFTATEHKP
ncbi:MAG: gamma-glutamylcyclotransferase family protein [Gammaproteobacteria bacterium]